MDIGKSLSLRRIKILSCKQSLLQDREHKILKSEARRCVLVCRYDKTCKYRIVGKRKLITNSSHKDDREYIITKSNLIHTCKKSGKGRSRRKILPMTSSSLAATNGMLKLASVEKGKHPGGKRVLDEVCNQLELTEGELQELTRGSSIMCAVYRSCRKAKENVVGGWNEGIAELESLKKKIELKGDGSILHIIEQNNVYNASLLICGGMVEAMKSAYAPAVFSADFTFAKSLYGAHGQWWALSCPDAEGHIVPLAVGHCAENENKVILLRVLKICRYRYHDVNHNYHNYCKITIYILMVVAQTIVNNTNHKFVFIVV